MSATVVREEKKSDRTAVEAIVWAAFDGPAEANLVAALREGSHVVLSLVAEETMAGIVGQALFSRVAVETPTGPAGVKAAALAPVAVSPDHRGEGIGGLLIREGLERLAARGEDICFVLGDPDYYARFGFEAGLAARFESAYAGPHFMARALRPLDTAMFGSRLVYPPPFAALG